MTDYVVRARVLDAANGRWRSKDPLPEPVYSPLWFGDIENMIYPPGQVISILRARSNRRRWNATDHFYTYARNNAPTRIDPSGEACQVFYNCKLVSVSYPGITAVHCRYACTESDKPRKPIYGVGVILCDDPLIPKSRFLDEPGFRVPLCRGCSDTLEDWPKLYDEWGVFFDCEKKKCLKEGDEAADKGKLACKLLPAPAKTACNAFWTAWKEAIVALCAKCMK